jgi:molecular chaperone HscC
MQAVNGPGASGSASVVVGVDLGTTYSLVSVLRDGQPIILPNALGLGLTPSAVSIGDDGRVYVGEAARARATTHPRMTAQFFKRDMGTDRRYTLGAHSYSATELSSFVLRSIKEDAERALGQPVKEAVITVPAYFDELARRATRDAAVLAGLDVKRIVNEPTAAALAYGLHQRHRRLRGVVLDLGGGTFDVTVLQIADGIIEIESSAGDARLGGEDFVEALADHLVEARADGAALRADATSWARLRVAVEAVKKELSAAALAEVRVKGLVGGASLERSLSREEAEACWRPLLERIRGPIARALRDARLRAADVDEVLLVGGATRMPCVRGLVEELFGRPAITTLPPDEAVALGAGVQAALVGGDAAVDDMIVTDVAPFSLGISSGTSVGRQRVTGLFSPIIDRGTVLPASRVQRFSTMDADQAVIDVEVFQGEHPLCRDNVRLGALRIDGLPRGAAGAQSVDVRFTYDLSGLLEVDVTTVSTSQTRQLVVDRTQGGLSAAQIEETRRRFAALKFHPRESLPNATALHRAEAAYLELTGEARAMLGEAIARFSGILESQDTRLIDEERAALLAMIDHAVRSCADR